MSETPATDAGAALLASPVRRGIVDQLERFAASADDAADVAAAGGMTAAQLAGELGLHVTTVRFHLDQLESAGLVLSHFTTAFGVGRPRKVYTAVPLGDGQDRSAAHLRLLAGLLTDSFATDVTPQQAGEQWVRRHVTLRRSGPAATPGAWLANLGQIIDVLQAWGYTPNLTTTDGGRSCRIDLVDCPFLDLARSRPEVVCGIHRGLLTGALGLVGEDEVEVSVQPFVGPALCHAHVSTHRRFESPAEESDES